MFQKLERSITRSARLVLDVREWYASKYGPGSGEITLPDQTKIRPIIRPDVKLTVTARSTQPRDPRWPFAGPVELVMVRTPVGLLAFFGRARSIGEGPLRRLTLEGTRCLLRLEGPGYQAVDLSDDGMSDVEIPAAYEPTKLMRIDLLPGADYPFPPGPTLLRGTVLRPDATGVSGATVTLADNPAVRPANTDDTGQWVLVLEQETDGQTVASPVDLLFQIPGSGTPIRVAGIVFHAGQDEPAAADIGPRCHPQSKRRTSLRSHRHGFSF